MFGAFVALGLTTMVSVQAFVNISVVLGLMPTKGHPAAVCERRRFVAADQPARHGRAAEHLAATRRRKHETRWNQSSES